MNKKIRRNSIFLAFPLGHLSWLERLAHLTRPSDNFQSKIKLADIVFFKFYYIVVYSFVQLALSANSLFSKSDKCWSDQPIA